MEQRIVDFTPAASVNWNGASCSCGNGAECSVHSIWSSDSTSFSSHGASSLQQSFEHSIEGSVSAGGWFVKGSFTAGSKFHEMSSEMNENSYHTFFASGVCSIYQMQLKNTKWNSDYTLNSDFKNAVAYLDLASNETFFEVTDAFGTHYTTGVIMGGQCTRRIVFTDEHYKSATASGHDFEAMDEVSYAALFSASGGYSEQQEEECTEQFDSKSKEMSQFYVGGGAYETDPQEWYKKLTEDVESIAPLGSCTEIAPLFELMPTKNFPEINDIEEKQLLLTEAYCDRVTANGGYCEKNPFDGEDQEEWGGGRAGQL